MRNYVVEKVVPVLLAFRVGMSVSSKDCLAVVPGLTVCLKVILRSCEMPYIEQGALCGKYFA